MHDRLVGLLHKRAGWLEMTILEKLRIFLTGNKAAGEWEEFVRAFTRIETYFFRDHDNSTNVLAPAARTINYDSSITSEFFTLNTYYRA